MPEVTDRGVRISYDVVGEGRPLVLTALVASSEATMRAKAASTPSGSSANSSRFVREFIRGTMVVRDYFLPFPTAR